MKRSAMTGFSANDIHLRICTLRQDQIDQAFAGLEPTGLPLSLTAWWRYALDRIDAGPANAGVLSLQCARAYIHGLLGYEIVAIGSERHMTVDLFRTVDYLSEKTAGSLMATAEAIAADHHHSSICKWPRWSAFCL